MVGSATARRPLGRSALQLRLVNSLSHEHFRPRSFGDKTATVYNCRSHGFGSLRITIDEKQDSVILRLEGKLICPWVEEVEQCWRNVFATLGGRSVQVDLSAVSFVDTAGGALLVRMHEAGFRLAGGRPMMAHPWHGDENDSRSGAN
jgi:ABC-type transporter Mla MlaB component